MEGIRGVMKNAGYTNDLIGFKQEDMPQLNTQYLAERFAKRNEGLLPSLNTVLNNHQMQEIRKVEIRKIDEEDRTRRSQLSTSRLRPNVPEKTLDEQPIIKNNSSAMLRQSIVENNKSTTSLDPYNKDPQIYTSNFKNNQDNWNKDEFRSQVEPTNNRKDLKSEGKKGDEDQYKNKLFESYQADDKKNKYLGGKNMFSEIKEDDFDDDDDANWDNNRGKGGRSANIPGSLLPTKDSKIKENKNDFDAGWDDL